MKGDSSRNSSERKTPKIPVYADELPHFGLSKPVRGDIIPEIVPILNFIEKALKDRSELWERVLFTNYGVFAGIVETCLRYRYTSAMKTKDIAPLTLTFSSTI